MGVELGRIGVEVIGVKPTRNLTPAWWRHLAPERRASVISFAILLALLAALFVYQRLSGSLPAPAEPKGQMVRASQTEPGQAAAAQDGAGTHGGTEPAKGAAEPLKLVPPLAGGHAVQQGFAFAYSEAYGDFRLHGGIDYQAAQGDIVKAAAAGTVTAIENHPADGVTVMVDHGNGYATRYAGITNVRVPLNSKVRAGDPLAEVGAPGLSHAAQGPQLHFELLVGGEPVDPTPYLGAR
jgi:murein DD-endopeptidase MepM/ murein hydrolase activator NlpD